MSDDGPHAALDGLQLDRAEFADQEKQQERCAACGQPLAGSYYEINGKICCAACRERLAATFEKRPGPAGFLRAAGAGLAAAILGAGIYFAVRAASGYEIGLISILVGYLVGKAVRWGCGGRGGWLYQTLAVLLTYLAIVSTYVPMIFAAARKAYDAEAATAAATPGGASAQVTPPAAGIPRPSQPESDSSGGSAGGRPSPGAASPRPAAARTGSSKAGGLASLVAGFAVLLLIATTVPFIGGVHVIGWIIIAVGLFEAWKLNQRPRLDVRGPHALAPAVPAGPATLTGPVGPAGWKP
jgi:hypothetical protein